MLLLKANETKRYKPQNLSPPIKTVDAEPVCVCVVGIFFAFDFLVTA